MKLYYTVRELSTSAPEIWALRSLGGEVLVPSRGLARVRARVRVRVRVSPNPSPNPKPNQASGTVHYVLHLMDLDHYCWRRLGVGVGVGVGRGRGLGLGLGLGQD